MKDKDKLRFELGVSFNKLSATNINEVLSSNIHKGKYNSYNEYVNDFCYMLRTKYPDDEDFIQAIAELCGPRKFGWALANLHDNDIYSYAREKLIDTMKEKGLNSDDIYEWITHKELPK